MKQFISKYYPFLPLIILCGFYLFKSYGFSIHDFGNYHFGGYFVKENSFNAAIYFPYEFNKAISDLGHQNLFLSYAPNTPFLALCFVPLSLISVLTAKLIFNCISIILFLISIHKLFNFYQIDRKYILLLPILFLIPIKNNILFGQVYFLLFYLLTEFWLAYEREKLIKAALFLSVSILFKVFPIYFIFIFLFKKQTKISLYVLGFCCLFLGISILFLNTEIWIFWLNAVFSKASNGEIAGVYVDNYQSTFMFLKRLFVENEIENPNAFYHNPNLFKSIFLALKIGVILLGYLAVRNKLSSLYLFSYWILVSIFISPYGSTYTFILLVFPLLFILKDNISISKKIAFCLCLFLISIIPVLSIIALPFPFSYLRLFVFITLFFVFLLPILKSIKYKWVLAFLAIIPVYYVIQSNESDKNSKAILDKNTPILIFDFQIEKDKIAYKYWNEKGVEKAFLPMKIENFKWLKVENNQIYHNGKPLEIEAGNKTKAMLINEKTILFLSDFERGIGFYNLRKVALH